MVIFDAQKKNVNHNFNGENKKGQQKQMLCTQSGIIKKDIWSNIHMKYL